MSTSIKHQKFVDSVLLGIQKAIDKLIEQKIKTNDDLVVMGDNGTPVRVKAKDLKANRK